MIEREGLKNRQKGNEEIRCSNELNGAGEKIEVYTSK
jgi:hypothetical protein